MEGKEKKQCCCEAHEHEREHEHEHEYSHEHKHEHEHGCCCDDHDEHHHHDHREHGCDHDGCGCGHEHGGGEEGERKKMIVRLAASGTLLVVGLVIRLALKASLYVQLPLFLFAYLLIGYDVVIGAVRGLLRGKVFGESFLMSVSSIGAFCLGEFPEAVAVMLFYQLGELLEDFAVDRSRDSIADLMDIRPDSASVWADGAWVSEHPEHIAIGSRILVKPGERVPLDGVILEGKSALDTRALTGESVPRTVREGDPVLSGCINTSGALVVETTKSYAESTASKILDLVENAANRKAPSERFISRFARYYTPIVVGLAVLVAVIPSLVTGNWAEWIRKSFVFLVISCPCALVISVPLTFFGGVGAASKHGILIKGSNYLEALNDVRFVAFDKTGTLTRGEFAVQNVFANGISKEELLSVAASAEQLSTHPIARSILDAKQGELSPCDVYEEISGQGVRTEIDGQSVLVGNEKLLFAEGIDFTPCDEAGTKVYVAREGAYLGCIVIADGLKPDSRQTVDALRSKGIRTVLLTGDVAESAKPVADALGVDAAYADLLPQNKVETIELLQQEGKGKVVFVGDGINDAPVLARADIGVAMGALGSDAAIEAADVVLMNDEPKKLIEAIDLAKATRRIVIQNIVFALGVKVLFMLLGVLGIAGMWIAVIGDVGVMLLAVLNAMRVLKK